MVFTMESMPHRLPTINLMVYDPEAVNLGHITGNPEIQELGVVLPKLSPKEPGVSVKPVEGVIFHTRLGNLHVGSWLVTSFPMELSVKQAGMFAHILGERMSS